MTRYTAHIINHTHWDREWFLTSVYTSRWIGGLIDRLAELVESNPNFHFFLDGQTLVIEDLFRLAPQYQTKVDKLVRNGNLLIGPYYCQPDWRLTGGEALVRNFLYGRQDMEQLNGGMDTGWLVDTFGHISQAPQLHHLFGIHSVYIWRGTPQLEPYFLWRGADGTLIFTINLFGGYRNLYGVTHVPEIAAKRLQIEVHRLQPYYPTDDIPLFDGYDLEDNPEDPLRFYQTRQAELSSEIQIREATPASYAMEIRPKLQDLPILTGELMSGKYGAVFPGTLSSRNYLKVMARDCEHLLYQVCEPLGAMARLRGRAYPAEQYEAWSRILLQNAVHDCICGVSIDQVHEKMEYSYRQAFDAMLLDMQSSLASILQDFAPGNYTVSTNPFSVDSWQVAVNHLIHAKSEGVGVWPVDERVPVEILNQPVDSFTWRNEYYEATVNADGLIGVGAATLGELVVSREKGDTYSDERGERLGVMSPISPLSILQKSSLHCIVGFTSHWQAGKEWVTASVRLQFDPSPLLKWEIDLDSRGTDLRIEMVFETARTGECFAGMPFDLVRRPVSDTNLLPRQLPHELSSVLLGQRELGSVSTFPFQDFVSVSDGEKTVSIFAKGIHAYTADEKGTVKLTLRRAVEWLTKSDLKNRVGDAGPFFYVPDARCERAVSHGVAVVFGPYSADSMMLQALNSAFQNPPLIVHSQGHGTQTTWQVFHEEMPISSLSIQDEKLLARFYNPTSHLQPLTQSYLQTDVWGRVLANVDSVQSKQIVTVQLAQPLPDIREGEARVEYFTPPKWRVGKNAGSPDPKILALLKKQVTALEEQIAKIEDLLAYEQGTKRLQLQHQSYVLKRECVELKFSLLLNQRKLEEQGALSYEYLYLPDEEIATLGLELNRLRIKRRIFDYVVQAL